MTNHARSSLFDPIGYSQNPYPAQQSNELQSDFIEGQIQSRTSQLRNSAAQAKDIIKNFKEEVENDNKILEEVHLGMNGATHEAKKMKNDVRNRVENNTFLGIINGQSRLKEICLYTTFFVLFFLVLYFIIKNLFFWIFFSKSN